MYVDRSFFPGLTFLNDKLIRLDLVPPQLKDVPDAKPEIDAGTDQQSGIVAAVGHPAFNEGVGLGPPQGGGGALASNFTMYSMYGREVTKTAIRAGKCNLKKIKRRRL